MSRHHHARAHITGPWPAGESPVAPPPFLVSHPDAAPRTGLIMFPQADALPALWAGPVPASGLDPGEVALLLGASRPCTLLPEHGAGWFGRPGLCGHRLNTGDGRPVAGRNWSPRFRPTHSDHDGTRARVEGEDAAAG